MRRIIGMVLSMFTYFIALFMMYAGIDTMFVVPEQESRLGFIYESRMSLAIFGIIFFTSGLTLMAGKVIKRQKIIGYGLMAIYLCFLFAGILNWYALGFESAYGNLIASIIIGLLYLRCKYNIYYPQHVDTRLPVV